MKLNPKQLNLTKDIVMAGGRIVASTGSATAPSISFSGNSTSGLYISSGNIALGVAGNLIATFSSAGITGNLLGNATSASTATKLTTARNIAHSGDATGSASFDGTANVSIPLTLATVNSAPGAYGNTTSVATFTVNAKGLVTLSGSAAIAFPVSSVSGKTGAVTLASADITDATASSTANTVVKRDASGNFAASTITAALTGNASTASKLAAAHTISHTGDVAGSFSFDGSTDVSSSLTLASVNANTGTFNTLTVNAKGLVTAASNTAYLTGNQTITLSGDATGSGTTSIPVTLANSGVTAGNYSNSWVQVNNKGIITSIANGITQYRYYYADQFETPNSSDWSVNNLAPAMNDTTNAAIVIRAFDDTAEEGVGFTQGIPLNATNIVIRVRGRSAVAANSGGVVLRLHIRTLVYQTPAAISAWSITTLPTMTVPANAFFQSYSNTFTFASLGISPQSVVQFELTRQGSNSADTLTGDFNLLELAVAFT